MNEQQKSSSASSQNRLHQMKMTNSTQDARHPEQSGGVMQDVRMRLSDDYMRSATSNALSTRGQVDSAFEAGYFAMLTLFSPEERLSNEHPSAKLLAEGARRLNLDEAPGLLLERTRYAASEDERVGLDEALAWAKMVRQAVEAR